MLCFFQWELGCKESWVPESWCFWTVVLEKTLENPLDWKEIKPVNPEFWIFIGRTDSETEASILRPLQAKNWLLGKDPDAGKDWRQEEKGSTGDEMVGWHHQLNGHEFEQTLGVGDEQGKPGVLQSMGSWREELDMTACLNWTELLKECTFNMSQFPCIWHVLTGSSL